MYWCTSVLFCIASHHSVGPLSASPRASTAHIYMLDNDPLTRVAPYGVGIHAPSMLARRFEAAHAVVVQEEDVAVHVAGVAVDVGVKRNACTQ